MIPYHSVSCKFWKKYQSWAGPKFSWAELLNQKFFVSSAECASEKVALSWVHNAEFLKRLDEPSSSASSTRSAEQIYNSAFTEIYSINMSEQIRSDFYEHNNIIILWESVLYHYSWRRKENLPRWYGYFRWFRHRHIKAIRVHVHSMTSSHMYVTVRAHASDWTRWL